MSSSVRRLPTRGGPARRGAERRAPSRMDRRRVGTLRACPRCAGDVELFRVSAGLLLGDCGTCGRSFGAVRWATASRSRLRSWNGARAGMAMSTWCQRMGEHMTRARNAGVRRGVRRGRWTPAPGRLGFIGTTT